MVVVVACDLRCAVDCDRGTQLAAKRTEIGERPAAVKKGVILAVGIFGETDNLSPTSGGIRLTEAAAEGSEIRDLVGLCGCRESS